MFPLGLSLFLVLCTIACESENSSSTDNSAGDVSTNEPGVFGNSADATLTNPISTSNGPIDFGMVIEEKNSQLTDGELLHFNQFIPEGCTSDTPCPFLMLVSDKATSGDEFFGEITPRWLAAKTGAVVATYNAPGRGVGGRKSTGDEDYNGTVGQDALSDVLNYMIKNVRTNDQVGIISFGYGLVVASGAFSRFKASKLKEVDFLLDVEGPVNRCWTTSAPGNIDTGIDKDGPGINESRCDFDLGPRPEAFPPLLPGGAPAAVVCNENAFPIKGTGINCEEDAWWQEREAKTFLDDIQGNYLRIQMLYDHRQASRWAALEAIKYVVKSDVENHIMNNMVPNQPLHTVGDATCLENGSYLDFTSSGLGNSIVFPECFEGECVDYPNPYAAAFEGYEPMNLDSFAENILPLYVDLLFDL